MDTIRESQFFPSGRLRERVKELRCLQGIVSVIETPGLGREEILQGIVDLIPTGWQYPMLCQARIKLRDAVFATPDFEDTAWTQRVPLRAAGTAVGWLEVSYSAKISEQRGDPFLLEEKKLIELVAGRLGRLVEEWESPRAVRPGGARAEAAPARKPEWVVIMGLLKETDPVLYRRVLRRLMNHLHWQGVPGVQGLLLQFTPDFYSAGADTERDENQPLPLQDVEALERVFEEAMWIASLAIPEREMASLIKQWMRQDKFGFFILATEKRDISLIEIKEIINRFCRSTSEDEQALSRADDLQARIALIRRFISDRLQIIGIGRDHMTVHDFGRLLTRVTGPSQGTGKLGGKAAGMVLAEHILRKKRKDEPAVGEFRIPESRFITSDGLIDFIHYNFLEDFQSFKFSPIEEIRHNYPYLEQVCKHSFFSAEMQSQLKLILDDMGEDPLIVRSSSLLEDNKGTAFSGKYRSLFLANTGTKEERLAALSQAIAEVYASILTPTPSNTGRSAACWIITRRWASSSRGSSAAESAATSSPPSPEWPFPTTNSAGRPASGARTASSAWSPGWEPGRSTASGRIILSWSAPGSRASGSTSCPRRPFIIPRSRSTSSTWRPAASKPTRSTRSCARRAPTSPSGTRSCRSTKKASCARPIPSWTIRAGTGSSSRSPGSSKTRASSSRCAR